VWTAIEALDNLVPAATQTWLLQSVAQLVDQAARWFLGSGLPLDIGPRVAQFRPGVVTLLDAMSDLLPERERAVNADRARAYVEAGAPASIAAHVVALNTLSAAMDIVQIGEACGRDMGEVARIYFAAGVDFGLLEVRRRARAMPVATPWQRLAADALTEDSHAQQRDIVRRLVSGALDAGAVAGRTGPGTPLRDVLDEIARTTPPDLAMLTVATRRSRAAAA
jgi:glutamate dehydrogenase